MLIHLLTLVFFRLFHRKYAEAKQCAKNATFVLCTDTPQLRDDVDFIYDGFNPFCFNLSDPPASEGLGDSGERLPPESGLRRPTKASTGSFIRRSDSISSAAQSITAKLLTFVVPLCLPLLGLSLF